MNKHLKKSRDAQMLARDAKADLLALVPRHKRDFASALIEDHCTYRAIAALESERYERSKMSEDERLGSEGNPFRGIVCRTGRA